MGREASCHCDWAGEAASCKVLLESTELVIRGAFRRRVPLSALRKISVQADQLQFRVDDQDVSLRLGAELAQRWAKALVAPPASLAKKLGISSASHVLLIGAPEDAALQAALAEAGTVGGPETNLILACVQSQKELDEALSRIVPNVALWIIYPKGPGHRISEAGVRDTLRARGFMDTKAASVSAYWTALRFSKRSGARSDA